MADVANHKPPTKINRSFREFAGLNTQANRTMIADEEFAWLENIQPIGHGNMPALMAPTDTGVSFAATCYRLAEVNLSNTDYHVAFLSNGAATQVNLTTYATTVVAGAATFSGGAAAGTQWKNTLLLVIDTNGYFSWDGTTLTNLVTASTVTAAISGTTLTVTAAGAGSITVGSGVTGAGVTTGTYITAFISGTGGTGTYTVNASQSVGSESMTVTPSVPTTGTSIAVFAGRVWIANGRTVSYSAPDSYTDFTTADFGGSFIVSDSTLHSTIIQLLTANSFLYLVGQDSVNVISDVRVSGSATVFSNLNLVTTAGTPWAASVVPYYRTVWMASKYGFMEVTGPTARKGSDALDGLWPNIDLTQPVSGGVCVLNSVLCLAFLFQYNDTSGSRPLLAVFFNKKWFLASQGTPALTLVASGALLGSPALFGTDGTKFYKLFSSSSAAISQTLKTRLWDMGDPILTKQAFKLGLEIVSPSIPATISATVDSELAVGGSSPVTFTPNTVTWTNNSAATVTWQNNALNTVQWAVVGYQFSKGDVSQFGKYLGVTLTSSTAGQTYAGVHLQYENRGPW